MRVPVGMAVPNGKCEDYVLQLKRNVYGQKQAARVYQNLPCPKTFEMDSHACVSISDILNHSLAMGIEIDVFRSSYHKEMAIDNKDLMHVKRSHDILKEVFYSNESTGIDPYVFLLIIWSDGFEVNHTKKTAIPYG